MLARKEQPAVLCLDVLVDDAALRPVRRLTEALAWRACCIDSGRDDARLLIDSRERLARDARIDLEHVEHAAREDAFDIHDALEIDGGGEVGGVLRETLLQLRREARRADDALAVISFVHDEIRHGKRPRAAAASDDLDGVRRSRHVFLHDAVHDVVRLPIGDEVAGRLEHRHALAAAASGRLRDEREIAVRIIARRGDADAVEHRIGAEL